MSGFQAFTHTFGDIFYDLLFSMSLWSTKFSKYSARSLNEAALQHEGMRAEQTARRKRGKRHSRPLPVVFCSFVQPYKQFAATRARFRRRFLRLVFSMSPRPAQRALTERGGAAGRRGGAVQGESTGSGPRETPRSTPVVLCSFVQLYEWFGVVSAWYERDFLRFRTFAHRGLATARSSSRVVVLKSQIPTECMEILHIRSFCI